MYEETITHDKDVESAELTRRTFIKVTSFLSTHAVNVIYRVGLLVVSKVMEMWIMVCFLYVPLMALSV